MAIKFPDKLKSNNPKEYGIIDSAEISGHRHVKTINDLLTISDAILSSSGNNTDNDAIGQLWYVISEKFYYKLIDWAKRKSLEGWAKDDSKLILGTIPVYSSEDEVPTIEEEPTAPEEYVVLSADQPAFEPDEEKNMFLNALNALVQRVSRIERTFTDHMDCGEITNDKMIIVGNDKTVEEKEPIWASDTGEPMPDPGNGVPEIEPADTDLLKVTHLSIKSGKWEDFTKITKYLLPFELVWIYDNSRLYIKQKNGKMCWINNGEGGGGGTDPDPELPDMDNVEYIQFISPNKNKWRVTMSDEGQFKILNERKETEPDASQIVDSGTFKGLSKSLYLPLLYINSIYCGGLDIEKPSSYQPCSHNFVELSNLTKNDISLNGLSLQYSINGTIWEVLKLEGIIKAGSTFLIRGAQCSKIEANTTRIKVKEFDMEWTDSNGQLIKFSTIKCKFLLTYGTEPCNIADPYKQDTSATDKAYCKLGYIDMVGLNKTGATSAETIDGFERNQFTNLSKEGYLYMKYYAMDSVKQATKTIGKRNNEKDWTWVNLNLNLEPNITVYTPRASYENKNIFYNKTKLDNDKPEMINVTFGINAHKTRCFNWISLGYYDEYLWYKKKGGGEYTKIESFKEGDSRSAYTSKWYNRIRIQATDKSCYTSHKVIITNLEPGTYEYKCGRIGHESETRYFKVVAQSEGDFSFIQVSDQQGFNWIEYEVWKKAANFIRKEENPLFTINTGDMTQNGNRISEWLDYYTAGENLFHGKEIAGNPEFAGIEQMNIIGNNDLCPKNFEILGDGSDLSKISSVNFQFFYCYEMDEDNMPIINHEGVDYFIPSLYSFNYNGVHFVAVNSEIPDAAQNELFGGADVYTFVKSWLEKDFTKYSSARWKIAYCHEAPFTIITQALIKSFLSNPETARGGSRLNTDIKSGDTYWFSKLIEKHGVRLCLCGHKHTYSVSYPLIDTVEDGRKLTMQPTIQTTDAEFANKLDETQKKLCKVSVVSKITAPVYAMCQASGYKQTSNKELPAEKIPWLEAYFPAVGGKANAGQKYPFYIKWTIKANQIVGDVVKLDNIMTSGTFNINVPNTKPITKLNGNGTTNKQIIINK